MRAPISPGLGLRLAMIPGGSEIMPPDIMPYSTEMAISPGRSWAKRKKNKMMALSKQAGAMMFKPPKLVGEGG